MCGEGLEALRETGYSRLVNDLAKLPVSLAVFQIGAHPDDEDNSLLAYLSWGLHADTYYLVANWGEGGQNEIGPELYDALGAIRSQELAAARVIDGARQLYLGAYDFGFSKSAQDTFAHWDREALLRRLVGLFRRYEPDIVLTPHAATGGHGQHQAVGELVLQAFDAAADTRAFPEQLRDEGLHPWRIAKLYVADPIDPTVCLNVGEFNPVLGRTYHEIGQLARSQHRSQGMGGSARKGHEPRGYRLVRSARPAPRREESVLDGIDASLAGIARDLAGSPPVLARVARKALAVQSLAGEIMDGFRTARPHDVAELVARGLATVRELDAEVAQSDLPAATRYALRLRLSRKEHDFQAVGRELLGTFLEVTSNRRDVPPGRSVGVSVSFWNCGALVIEDVRLKLAAPSGWQVRESAAVGQAQGGRIEPGGRARCEFEVALARDAAPTGPHDPPPLHATASWRALGVEFTDSRAADVLVVPAVSVSLHPDTLVVPTSSLPCARDVQVKLTDRSPGPTETAVEVSAPDGWGISVPAAPLRLRPCDAGAETVVRARVSVPADAPNGTYPVCAMARRGAEVHSTGYEVIAHPHIRRTYLYRPAQTRVAVMDVRVVPGLEVGYVDSGLDDVPGGLRALGVRVTPLTAGELRAGELRRYDTIVVGIRAYLRRPDLVASNIRLLEYVLEGGNLIVQYNKAAEWRPAYAPYPLTVSTSRVASPAAPVTILRPDHPVFNAPNRINSDDWEGWVQERGVYFPCLWDDRYVPLVECADPGEQALRGAWLVTRYGEGTYMYTTLSWYRQLRALVPGAFRMLANMVSLARTR